MKTKNITINIPEGYDDVRFNEKTKEIEFVKKDSKPRSWKEYCDKVVGTDCFRAWFAVGQEAVSVSNRLNCPQANEFNTEEEAKAFLALGKLIQLRDAWWGDWKPDWKDNETSKFIIFCERGVPVKNYSYTYQHTLAFPTEEMRNDFLKTFRDLIEEAKILL